MSRPFVSRNVVRFAAASLGLALASSAASAQTPKPLQAALLQGPDGGEVRSLVVGIDAYKHVRPLKGAVADARDIEGSLRKMGVKDITTLIDDQVERTVLIRELERMVQRSRSGDLVVLALAGHGVQEPERVKGSQPDGMDTVFLLSGFDTTRTGSQQRVIGTEFNHFIKKIEARGARVLFVTDACHGAGLARDVDPRAEEMSYRQVTRYTIPVDDLKPISTAQEAFLTELDFEKTAFLAAVDRKTKAPEIRIPGVPGFRGALSYSVARALEGNADVNGDGKITLKELFTNVRQVVYQLSDQRQNPVTMNSPNRNVETDVVFAVTRGVTLMSAAPTQQPAAAGTPGAPAAQSPVGTAVAGPTPAGLPAGVRPETGASRLVSPVRIASLDGQSSKLRGLTVLEAPHEVVTPNQQPDLIWDPNTGDVIVGGDVIAYKMDKSDLPSVIDRAAAVRGFKQLAAKAPQPVKLDPNDKLHRNETRVSVEVGGVSGRALILFNIAGDGTVQALYPIGSDPPLAKTSEHRLPVRVREPFGADQIVAITSDQRMTALEQALKQMNQRRTAVQMLKMVERYGPADVRIGTLGLFTAP